MLDRLAAWRHKPALWVVPLAFVAVNVLALVIFQTAFAGRLDALKRTYDRQAERLERLQAESERAGRFVTQLTSQEEAGEVLYSDYFATEGERFTSVLREVRQRAREAGMDPLRFSYPAEEVQSYGLMRRGVNFGVKGTYEQLRQFINLLELTDEFITLESVKLGEVTGARGGNADPRLAVSLQLSTMFINTEYVAPEPVPEPAVLEQVPEEGELEGEDEET